ncbi:MAG: enoyl-CoA hydratase/isomerase family protein, partial [Pseudomonadota bacterium]|nr:enoyl-CoA hydratase/isomerase family protein [Pseudomonadota bacterium]
MNVPLKIERAGATWTFTLNRPEKRNALSAELVDALLAGVEEAHRDGAALLVFRGEGKNFSAGFDFGDFDTQSEGDLLLRFVRIEALLHMVARSPCLTVALVHGRNFGAGVDLIACCRQRIAVPETTFRMPGLKFGLVLGTRRFADLVGRARAAAILHEARTFDAAEAQAIGFVEALVDAADWPATLDAARKASTTLDAQTRASLY